MLWLHRFLLFFNKLVLNYKFLNISIFYYFFYIITIAYLELVCLLTLNIYGVLLHNNIISFYRIHYLYYDYTTLLAKDTLKIFNYYFPLLFSLESYNYIFSKIISFYNFILLYPNINNINFFNINILNFFNFSSYFFYIVSLYYRFCIKIIFPIIVSSFILLILLDFFNIIFLRQTAIWFVICILFFWLISGFNFFLKRYKFGKFTSSIQRFWKQTNSYFWIVEGFLFSLFFYYYLNSSQEVLYFFDESNLNQNFLTNLSSIYYSSYLLLFTIFYMFYMIINLNFFNFKQQIFHFKIISIILVYGFLLESYQFYYVISGFTEITWDFSEKDNTWFYDGLSSWSRVKNQYITIALIVKYWHFLFIFISWLFMIFKFYELNRSNYILFGLNLQNYLLLFILNILFNINWFKWLFRRFFDESFFWFFYNYNSWTLDLFFNELTILIHNLIF